MKPLRDTPSRGGFMVMCPLDTLDTLKSLKTLKVLMRGSLFAKVQFFAFFA